MPDVQRSRNESKWLDSLSHGSSEGRRTESTTFVLIAGAWHGGWCWERVTPLLEAAGHRAIAPDLRGMGSDLTPLYQVTLAGWADQVTALIAREPEPVMLVGHSRSGIVISEVAERIRSLVYLTAALVPNGETLSATRTRTLPDSAHEWPALIADRTITLPRETIRPLFHHTTDSQWAARAEARIGGEPIFVMNIPLGLSEPRFGSVRRAFIRMHERSCHSHRSSAGHAEGPAVRASHHVGNRSLFFLFRSRGIDISPNLDRTPDARFQPPYRDNRYGRFLLERPCW